MHDAIPTEFEESIVERGSKRSNSIKKLIRLLKHANDKFFSQSQIKTVLKLAPLGIPVQSIVTVRNEVA